MDYIMESGLIYVIVLGPIIYYCICMLYYDTWGRTALIVGGVLVSILLYLFKFVLIATILTIMVVVGVVKKNNN